MLQEHINAPYLRALADGQQIYAKRPGDEDFEPLTCTSTTAFHALLLPTSGQLSAWEFKIEGIEDVE
ncbi:hypothetical protein [Comamonas sp.]|uniref:hypothetical protein n=1 Tax=Comamonas sp. TaxID=34028 RepID=UPI00289C497C|nr:hypothetical protein [Comamonas sp.]